MSFNLNPLNNNTPQIRTSHTQDGGAGNTGYFQQKNKDENQERDKSVFGEKKDSFTLSDAENFNYADTPLLLKVAEFFKNLVKKLFNK